MKRIILGTLLCLLTSFASFASFAPSARAEESTDSTKCPVFVLTPEQIQVSLEREYQVYRQTRRWPDSWIFRTLKGRILKNSKEFIKENPNKLKTEENFYELIDYVYKSLWYQSKDVFSRVLFYGVIPTMAGGVLYFNVNFPRIFKITGENFLIAVISLQAMLSTFQNSIFSPVTDPMNDWLKHFSYSIRTLVSGKRPEWGISPLEREHRLSILREGRKSFSRRWMQTQFVFSPNEQRGRDLYRNYENGLHMIFARVKGSGDTSGQNFILPKFSKELASFVYYFQENTHLEQEWHLTRIFHIHDLLNLTNVDLETFEKQTRYYIETNPDLSDMLKLVTISVLVDWVDEYRRDFPGISDWIEKAPKAEQNPE